MNDLSPVPNNVIQQVGDYVRSERRDAEKYDNRAPLDESGVYSLHMLAQSIYRDAWQAGYFAAETQRRADR